MPRPRAGRRLRKGKPVKSPPGRSDNSSDAILGAVGLDELRRLIRLVRKTGIGELEVRSGGRTVRISAQPGAATMAQPVWAKSPTSGSEPSTPAGGGGPTDSGSVANAVAITAPMVGTFYRAPAPDADPYVEVGDRVEVGQTVCIVEAMKLMNEIESEVKGRIVQVLVENAQPVEFGQKLFLVEPA